MRSNSKAITVLLFACMLFALLAPIKTPLKYNDEGFAVFNAVRVMDGDVPFKDFWSVYPPGQAYALAAVFQVFGTTLLVARIYDTILRFLIVVAVYFISRKVMTRASALFVSVTSTIFLSISSFYAYAAFPALAFGLLGFLCVLNQVNDGRRRWLVAGGALIGAASLFRWDFAVYMCFGALSAIILGNLKRNRPEEHPSAKRASSSGYLVAIFLGSVVATALPCYGYVVFKSGIKELWDQVIIFPSTILHEVRWRPYPKLLPRIFPSGISTDALGQAYRRIVLWLQFYLPLVVYTTVFGHYGLMWIRTRVNLNKREVTIIATAITGVLLFAQALSRYDYIHVMPSLLISIIILVYFIINIFDIISKSFMRYFNSVIIVIFSCIYMGLPIKTFVDFSRGFLCINCYSSIKRSGCVYITVDQENAIKYIVSNTIKDDDIFVGNLRHDIIHINDVAFYFLSERSCPTKYHMLHPGVATTYPIQQEIVHSIESKNIQFVVLVNTPYSNEPNASSISSGVHLLDEYIRSNYLPVAEFGNYGIWKRLAAS